MLHKKRTVSKTAAIAAEIRSRRGGEGMTGRQITNMIVQMVREEREALEAIDQAAQAVMAKHPSMNYAAAYERALRGMPKTYEKYKQSMGAGAAARRSK